MEDKIVKTITRIIIPFIQLYGIFIILHGHVSPGGGFSGGALIGTSLILLTLVFGIDKAKRKIPHNVSEIIESGGMMVFVAIGIVGLALGGNFLANIETGFPLGEPGTILSAGMIPLLMIAIGIKVASTMNSLFHLLIEGEIHEDN